MNKGIGVSSGYGIGTVMIIEEPKFEISASKSNDPNAELGRFVQALKAYGNEIRAQIEHSRENGFTEDAEILELHLQITHDHGMQAELIKRINEGLKAERALLEVRDLYVKRFLSSDVEFVRSKATDLRDVADRILNILLDVKKIDLSDVPEGTVLVAKDLSPSLTASIENQRIMGIVTQTGGATSHSALLAKSKGIPAVFGVKDIINKAKPGDKIIVDGSGIVILCPDEDELKKYEDLRDDYLYRKNLLNNFNNKPTLTKDGTPLMLTLNVTHEEDLDINVSHDGIGLLRTEYLFMQRDNMPSEEEQFEEYKRIAEHAQGKPVIVRTLDVGGDKDIPYLHLDKDENSFMGSRAIRYYLKNEDISHAQLRALLRASVYGNIKLLLPMVVEIDEIRRVKNLVKELMVELDLEGIAYNKNIQIGAMIETAAASIIADILAKEADFFSIGTNDLTSYTMAVDRGNSEVAYLYSPYQPAILRSVQHAVSCAQMAGIPVGMCGEDASNPYLIPVWLGIGLEGFSVSPSMILSTRARLSQFTLEEAKKITQAVLKMDNATEIEEYLKNR